MGEIDDLHRILLDESTDPIFAFFPDGTYRYVNHAFAAPFGLSPEEIIGRKIGDIFSPAEAEERFAVMKRVFETGETVVFEVRVPRSTSDLYYLTSVKPVRDANNVVVLVICFSKDITARKKMEEALRESEERYRRINDATLDYVYSYDLDGRFKSANRALCEAMGLSEREIVGKTHAQLGFPTEQCEARDRLHAKVSETGERVVSLTSTPMPGAGMGYFEVHLNPLRNDLGEFVGTSGTTRDITARTHAEQERKLLQDRLRASQKMEAIGRLAGGVAHDFNNLLSVILNYADFAMDNVLEGDPLHEDLQEIKKAGDRAALLTRQLLAFGRKQVLQPCILDLNTVVRGMEGMVRRLIGEDIELRVALPARLGKTRVDPSQIEQVIMNLLLNARDAMLHGGKITVETRNVEIDDLFAQRHLDAKPGSYVMLSVSDTGSGMDEATKARLFEPFFTTKQVGKGTGLGLATVYGIVAQSGGSISVYSELGVGTTFKIYFPEERTAQLQVSLSARPAAEVQGTETILVVEDEEAVRNLARRILEAGGYTVLAAANGGEALLVCEKLGDKIDLLLTDVVMPGMNGRELASRLSTICPTMKVLFMSGYTENAIVHHGVLDSATHFIGKPFSATELAHKIRETLKKTAAEKP